MIDFSSQANSLKYFSIALIALSGYHSWILYNAGINKIAEQVVINRNVSQVKQTWAGLQPSIQKWEKTFLHNDKVKDLVSLNSNLNIIKTGLKPLDDTLVEGVSEVVVFEGADLGLAERCIKNNNGGYLLTAPSVNAFLNGMENIDKRFDLNWKQVVIKAEKGAFSIKYSELCSRYRMGK